jgi:hypothetical protein
MLQHFQISMLLGVVAIPTSDKMFVHFLIQKYLVRKGCAMFLGKIKRGEIISNRENKILLQN